jgi:hypothetical protein
LKELWFSIFQSKLWENWHEGTMLLQASD